jgi:hypothetical protein
MNSKYDEIVSRRQLPVVLEVDELIQKLLSKVSAMEDNAHEDHGSVPFATVKPWLRDLQRVERHLKGACHFEGF